MLNYTESGDISQHLPILYTITRSLRPSLVLEIGIRRGCSTGIFTQAIKENDVACEHHCCDIDPECRGVVKAFGGIFHNMSSNDLAVGWDKPIDILFIDGCHEYSQVKRDFFNFLPFVRKDGIIFLHDTFPAEGHDTPTYCGDAYKILNDFGDIEHVTLPYQNGLTICRKGDV